MQGDARGLLSLGRQGLWARDGHCPCSVQGPLSPEPGRNWPALRFLWPQLRERSSEPLGGAGRASGSARAEPGGLLLTQRNKARLGHPRRVHSAWGWQARKCLLPHRQHSLSSSSFSALFLYFPPFNPPGSGSEVPVLKMTASWTNPLP